MILSLCLTWVAPAAAQEASSSPLSQVNVTGSFDSEGRYYFSDRVLSDFPEESGVFNYMELVSRSNLLADADAYQLGIQLDHVSMVNAWYYLDDVRTYELDLLEAGVISPWEMTLVNLEKAWFTADLGPVEVTVGDSYMSVGRGLALNLIKNTQIDVDTSLRGIKAESSLGAWDLSVVTGLTNQQQIMQDNPNRLIRANRSNLVNAVRVDRYGLGPVNVGAHGVVYNFTEAVEGPVEGFQRYGELGDPDALVGGVGAEAFLGPVDLFVEGDWFQYRDPVLFGGEEVEPGYAVYGTAAFYPGRFAVLVEGKRYKDTERLNTLTSLQGYEIATGPSLEYERVITEDSSAAVNSNDIYGGRVRADFMAKPGVFIPYIDVGVFRDQELGGLHFNRSPETIVHPVVGMDLQGDHVTALVNAGYRTDIRDEHGRDQLVHLDAAFSFPLPGALHGDATWDIYHFWWGENANQQHDFYTSTLALAAHHPSGVSAILYNDFTNDPLAQSQAKGNITDDIYMAGELQYMPNDRTQIRVFYGAYKAGIRCAGGQCRLLPAFEGARVAVTTSF